MITLPDAGYTTETQTQHHEASSPMDNFYCLVFNRNMEKINAK